MCAVFTFTRRNRHCQNERTFRNKNRRNPLQHAVLLSKRWAFSELTFHDGDTFVAGSLAGCRSKVRIKQLYTQLADMWRLEAARAEKATRDSAERETLAGTDQQGVSFYVSVDSSSAFDHFVPVDEDLATAQSEFWQACEKSDCWTVPMGRDLSAMPWLPHRSCGLLEALARSRRLRRRTALLIDSTTNRAVDTFFMYRPTQVIEAKMMVMDEHQGKRSLAQIREAARRSFVNAMRYGQILLVRMSNTAARFKDRYSDPKTFPLAIFDHEIVDGLMRQYSGAAGDNLYQSSHPLAACLREDDTDHGFFTVRQGFEVVVSTHFARDSFAGYLENCLPMEKLQPIEPTVASRQGAHGDGGSTAGDDVQGSAGAPEGELAEDAPWRLEDAQMGAVRLARRVEEMRARRADGSLHIVVGALGGAAAAGGGAGGGDGSAATGQARGGPRGSVSVPAPSTLAGVDARKTCDPAPGVRLVERNHEET